MSTFLTIAIPTCNRSESLDEQLRRVTEQVVELDRIDVLISDNASDDDTQKIVNKYSSRYEFINFINTEKNIGLDKNIYTLYEHAKGEYIWFLTDDDFVEDNVIENIAKIVVKNRPTVLTFNEINKIENESTDYCDQILRYTDWDNASSIESFWRVIMLSRLVVKRIPLNLERLKKLPVSTYPQITLALSLLQTRFDLCESSLQIINRKTGRVTNNLFKLYLIDIRQAIKNSQWQEATNRLLPSMRLFLKSFIKVQLMERAGYFYSKERITLSNLKLAWKEYENPIPERMYLILIFLISLIPRPIAKSLYFVRELLLTRSIKSASFSLATIDSWRETEHYSDV